MDTVLTTMEKEDLYKLCAKVIGARCWKKHVSPCDMTDIAGGMYTRLLSKRVGDVFPRGVPQSEAEWKAFLWKDAEFAWKKYFRKTWRHPTFSLNNAIARNGHEDARGEARVVDAINIDEDPIWQPNRKDDFLASFESQHELRFVPEVVDRLSAGCTPQTRKALKRLLLDETDIKTVSKESGMKPNALYVAKKRFLDALRQKGQAVLADIEKTAA